ncbi:hypothetical protein SSBR45G_28850 [Bradyrhizobium sp. SSBR45G]|uniref:S41 family peptidase n=1 Tax=unclassified Bradyrhizobium TaxID=2631580 RepID=UPI002342AB2C|nr:MULTISPECIES: PDZ domain-containing protein [unclassified Bradyrhizobium]GLH77977.1 hypothetical protein SSBR45G_28850 [Bradyrhizobium sp. SSBR45G]GLH85401.1 hypothetical protein SSBR45R_28610 [Bradyrhizobium sp. SSBR45R]
MQGGKLKVTSIVPDAPAARAGVKTNDIISNLDGESTREMMLGDALAKMRGPVGSSIRLDVRREGPEREIEMTVVRAPIRIAGTDLRVEIKDGVLQVEATGALPVLDFEPGLPIAVVPMSDDTFFVDAGDHTRLAFLHDDTGGASLSLNPGPWQIKGRRIN